MLAVSLFKGFNLSRIAQVSYSSSAKKGGGGGDPKKTTSPPPPPPPKKPEEPKSWVDKAGTILKGEASKATSTPSATPKTESPQTPTPQREWKEPQYPIGQRAEEYRRPNPNVKLPIKLRGVSGAYASLLFERAMTNKQLDKIAKDISSLQDLMKQNKKKYQKAFLVTQVFLKTKE